MYNAGIEGNKWCNRGEMIVNVQELTRKTAWYLRGSVSKNTRNEVLFKDERL